MKFCKHSFTMLVIIFVLMAVMIGSASAAETTATSLPSISVQLNGDSIVFPDAVPELTGGRTFVPLRAVMEAMDCQVDFLPGSDTVTAKRGDVYLSMVLGENKVTVTENSQTRTFDMDVVPYVKGGRTFIPVRFVAESLGCAVGWDQDTRTVVIIDIDTLLGDTTFELFDNFLAYCAKNKKFDNTALTGSLDAELKDTSGLDLKEPVRVKGSVTGVSGNAGLQMDWNFKADGLSNLLTDNITVSDLQSAIAFSDMSGKLLFDTNTATLYASLSNEIIGKDKSVWYSFSLGEIPPFINIASELANTENAGFRDILTLILKNIPVNDSWDSYDMVSTLVYTYTGMLGDKAFTQSGNTYTAKYGIDGVPVTVVFTKSGENIVSFSMNMDYLLSYRDLKQSVSLTEKIDADKASMNMSAEFVYENLSFNLSFNLSSVPTSKTPVTLPPADAEITPINK